MEEGRYEIRRARQSGGKAGKGRNKTSSIQVLYRSVIVKQFRFLMYDLKSWEEARTKAREYVRRNTPRSGSNEEVA